MFDSQGCREIEILKKTSEHEMVSEFRKLSPEKGNGISIELRAESMAFDFMENYTNKDRGWDSVLGRWLDIYEPRKDYTIDEFLQEFRKCKAFTATYIHNK